MVNLYVAVECDFGVIFNPEKRCLLDIYVATLRICGGSEAKDVHYAEMRRI